VVFSISLSAQVKKEMTTVAQADPRAGAIARGVGYLVTEAARSANNGDAARALLIASSKGFAIGTSLDNTLALLKQPAKWDNALTRLQLASALAVAERLGKAAPADLEAAAKLLVADQQPDGSWLPDQSQAGATPLTYGTIIATWLARTTLIASGIQPDFFSVVQADRWIRGIMPENVLDAAGTVLALELSSDVMAENLRRQCLSILRQAQSAETGGWGTTAPAPVFDSAMAVLALTTLDAEPRLARSAYTAPELKDAIANGKKFLVSQQRPDGSWPETTKPANQESYPQRISTSAWAMLALLAGS
jgi:hypothetical protein